MLTGAFSALCFASAISALYVDGNVTAPCDSPIYCHGDILNAIELARPFSDSKTFVDLPTIRPLDEVIDAFNNLTKPVTNGTELHNFLSTYFGQAGSELVEVPEEQLRTNATFLDSVADPDVKDFVRQVIDIWPDLTRSYVGAGNCSGCVDSFIPLNRTFVVAGGRFREPYYWDSFWIIEGLLRTKGSFTEIAGNIIENFLDLVELYGIVPNGARLYYLNRSQPPLLTQMVKTYIEYTRNSTILERAIPILEKEYEFWTNNRTVSIQTANKTYALNHYAVRNTQPRPESYLEDYQTVNNRSYYAENGVIYPGKDLDDAAKATLYANLATGAESGWDYCSRWLANPADAADDNYFPLRSLNTMNIVPVELNSILYGNEVAMAEFYNQTGNNTAAALWAERAANRSQAMYELMWNETHYSYFDYNLTSNGQNVFILADKNATYAETTGAGAPTGYQLAFNIAQYYPFWTGAAPSSLKDNPLAVHKAYTRVGDLLEHKPGAIAATNLETGEQWDQPNVWPHLEYILIKGLLNVPPTFGTQDVEYAWTRQTALQLAQRYLDSSFCTWRATGGATASMSRIAGAEAEGIMFEKYADYDINAAGGGGEYAVVEGFGWSNGVLIWAADVFGEELVLPECGNVTAADIDEDAGMRRRSLRNVVSEQDRRWTKQFARQK
ncbi:glycoside hydrolase family 37 protein [Aplosporella prunicola CBS 121167]|uniref:Trehalase n=1 Tax=Aplosporella prunicola CBS 121167 TaxID=1176127 RepID=A0A6A6BMB6_9PEZI|nr:glycoside hydrolase family 37 protein [Aplosporella prunicola CBS 121167]KAF2144543.1 glycoside hydrolase family 37 protein [Aplosporella prunicola CBS 121167]